MFSAQNFVYVNRIILSNLCYITCLQVIIKVKETKTTAQFPTGKKTSSGKYLPQELQVSRRRADFWRAAAMVHILIQRPKVY